MSLNPFEYARMRRVRAIIEVDGVEREMEFLTNNRDWSPRSVADLYRARWAGSFTRILTLIRSALWQRLD